MKTEIYDNKISNQIIKEIQKFDIEGISNYLDDPFTFNNGIVISNDKIVAAGIVRVVNELKIIIDPKIGNATKAKVLKLLMDQALSNRKIIQCNEVIALITQGEDHYINILKNHYEFQEPYGVFLKRGV